jgi:hypothetical protein
MQKRDQQEVHSKKRRLSFADGVTSIPGSSTPFDLKCRVSNSGFTPTHEVSTKDFTRIKFAIEKQSDRSLKAAALSLELKEDAEEFAADIYARNGKDIKEKRKLVRKEVIDGKLMKFLQELPDGYLSCCLTVQEAMDVMITYTNKVYQKYTSLSSQGYQIKTLTQQAPVLQEVVESKSLTVGIKERVSWKKRDWYLIDEVEAYDKDRMIEDLHQLVLECEAMPAADGKKINDIMIEIAGLASAVRDWSELKDVRRLHTLWVLVAVKLNVSSTFEEYIELLPNALVSYAALMYASGSATTEIETYLDNVKEIVSDMDFSLSNSQGNGYLNALRVLDKNISRFEGLHAGLVDLVFRANGVEFQSKFDSLFAANEKQENDSLRKALAVMLYVLLNENADINGAFNACNVIILLSLRKADAWQAFGGKFSRESLKVLKSFKVIPDVCGAETIKETKKVAAKSKKSKK